MILKEISQVVLKGGPMIFEDFCRIAVYLIICGFALHGLRDSEDGLEDIMPVMMMLIAFGILYPVTFHYEHTVILDLYLQFLG